MYLDFWNGLGLRGEICSGGLGLTEWARPERINLLCRPKLIERLDLGET